MRDVRIQKVLAEQGVCSRRAAEQLIREGRVKLNGRPVTVGDKMDTLKDLLTVDGQKVYVPKKSEKYYYMMYKPRGYITTTNDERGAQNGNGPGLRTCPFGCTRWGVWTRTARGCCC